MPFTPTTASSTSSGAGDHPGAADGDRRQPLDDLRCDGTGLDLHHHRVRQRRHGDRRLGDTSASAQRPPAPAVEFLITLDVFRLSATNYSFTGQSVTLTINPAALDVTANPQSMTYGGTVPSLTFSAIRAGQAGTPVGSVLSGGLTTAGTSLGGRAATPSPRERSLRAPPITRSTSHPAPSRSIRPHSMLTAEFWSNFGMTYGGSVRLDVRRYRPGQRRYGGCVPLRQLDDGGRIEIERRRQTPSPRGCSPPTARTTPSCCQQGRSP